MPLRLFLSFSAAAPSHFTLFPVAAPSLFRRLWCFRRFAVFRRLPSPRPPSFQWRGASATVFVPLLYGRCTVSRSPPATSGASAAATSFAAAPPAF
eukprot:2731295-Pleurochrysis_carterae.AAC.1